MINSVKEKNIFNFIGKKKVVTKMELTKILKCAGKTVQRRLKLWCAITSYNKNSKYYTLPKIAKFDEYGIWHFSGISFSKYGNLNETVIRLIKVSEAGLTGRELGNILGMEPRSFLLYFSNHAKLNRKKFNGRFVYFMAGKNQCRKQEGKREELEQISKVPFPSDHEAVVILIEFIKHPALSLDELTRNLCKKGIKSNREVIENFFVHHGLEKKTQN
jgi:hypothetical protein